MTATTAINDRFRLAAQRFTEILEQVPEAGWACESPCEGWSAADVVSHVIDTERDFLAQRAINVDAVDADRLRNWTIVRDAMQSTLDTPTIATQSYDGFFGPTTIEQTVDTFYTFDLIVHAWDVAKACGLVVLAVIPVEEIDPIRRSIEVFGDNIRLPGICGPEISVVDEADPQTKLLAFLGRRS